MFRPGHCLDGLEMIKNHIFTQNINNICAVCLQQHENYRTSSMQDMLSAQDKIEVYKVLESISLFKYSEKTPQLLCSTCSFKLLRIYEFQQTCNKSYFYLNNHFNQTDTQVTNELVIVDAADEKAYIESKPFIDKVEDNNCLQERVAKQDLIDVISGSSTFDNEVSRMEDSDTEEKVCKIEIEDIKIHNLNNDSEGSLKSIQKSSTEFQASTSTELTFTEGPTKICLESEIVRAGTTEGDGVTNESTKVDHQTGANIELTEHGAHSEAHFDLDKNESCIDARRGRISEFVCKYCNRVLASKQSLIGHENLHTGEKPYKCDQCTRTFAWPQCLDTHKVTHNPERRFCCNHCGKTFKHKGGLTQHLAGHTNARSHVCSICNKGFNWKANLMMHIQSHNYRDDKTSFQKAYLCDQCPKAYATPSGLTCHKLGHKAERPFVCDICAKTFKQRGSLTLHMKSHVNARSHVCSTCGKSFNYKNNLKIHMRRLHNNGDNDKSKIVKKS